MQERHRRTIGLLGAALLFCGAIASLATGSTATAQSNPAPSDPPSRPSELVALVVLDDVRADRMGLCGHARPTTPFLSRTCAEPTAVCRCRAYAPGSWTIPSHASFFTGLEVQHHGVGSPASQAERQRTQTFYRTLPDSVPTLADRMRERGYRTVALSANPVLNEKSGLLRGFDRTAVADSFGQWQGEALVTEVRRVLDEPDPEGRPLFLFLNIVDAHEPWLPVPEGLDWLPRRKHIRFVETVEEYRVRFMRGEMKADESAALLAHFSDVYDYGVHRADETLRRIVETFEKTGRLAGPHRIVITSDHGELLGEHGALGHGAALLYEGLSRVPLVVISSPASPPVIPDPVSALSVFDLVQGKLIARPVEAAAFAAPGWQKRYGDRWGRHGGAALWTAQDRSMLVEGDYYRFDLERDASGSETARPLADGPEKARLEALSHQLEQAASAPIPDGSEEITAILRALGYVE